MRLSAIAAALIFATTALSDPYHWGGEKCTADQDCESGFCNKGVCSCWHYTEKPCTTAGDCALEPFNARAYICDPQRGVCLRKQQVDGGPCVYDEQCFSKRCMEDGRCYRRGLRAARSENDSAPGRSLLAPRASCQTRDDCDAPKREYCNPETHECERLRAPGSKCDSNDSCWSNFCNNGICSCGVTEKPCDTAEDCRRNKFDKRKYFCHPDQGICLWGDLKSIQKCVYNEQCLSGHCDHEVNNHLRSRCR